MQKITPYLWFDKEAKEAAEFYTFVFPDSRITQAYTLHHTPSGDTEVVVFELAGFEFTAMSAGPMFKINPSVSFFVNFDPSRDPNARQNLDKMWAQLSAGGTVLMELGEYPFSQHYGWIQDRYGVSWQLILTNPEGEERPFIVPSLLFVGDVAGRAEEAIRLYLSVFKDSKLGTISRYPAGMEPDKEGTLMFADFQLEGQWFAAMDSAHPDHKFGFNEAISFLINCEDQAEIDYYWDRLTAVPEAEVCGWLKDRFGFSWQVAPNMNDMLETGTPEQVARVTEAFLKMKKFDMEELERAWAGVRA